MIRKTFAAVGIISVLLLTFLIPASALELKQSPSTYYGNQIFLPYTVSLTTTHGGSITTPDSRIINRFTLPEHSMGTGIITSVREYGFLASPVDNGDGGQILQFVPYLNVVTAESLTITLEGVTYTPVYDSDDNIIPTYVNDGLVSCAIYDPSYGFFGPSNSVEWLTTCDVAIKTSVGETTHASLSISPDGVDGYDPNGDEAPDLDFIVKYVYRWMVTPEQHVEAVTITNYRTTIYGDIANASLNFSGYTSDIHVPYTPIDGEDVHCDPVIFDGNVGVADLLIGPLEALINFEIFPNFSLGSVFAILAGISLFVIVLKVFAGG